MPIERVIEYTSIEHDEHALLIGWDTRKRRPVLARFPVIEDERELLGMVALMLMCGAVSAIPVSFGMFWLLRWLGV